MSTMFIKQGILSIPKANSNTQENAGKQEELTSEQRDNMIALTKILLETVQTEKAAIKEKHSKLKTSIARMQEEIDKQEAIKENKKRAEALKISIDQRRRILKELEDTCEDYQKQIDVIKQNEVKQAVLNISNSLTELTTKDITNLQIIEKPSQIIEQVLLAVQIILGEEQGWQHARQLMKHRGLKQNILLKKLQAFDKDSISEQQVQDIELIVECKDFEFSVESVSKKSKAAGCLTGWVLGHLEYQKSQSQIREKEAQIQGINKRLIEDESEVKSDEVLHQSFIDLIKKKLEELGFKILQAKWQQLFNKTDEILRRIAKDQMHVQKVLQQLECNEVDQNLYHGSFSVFSLKLSGFELDLSNVMTQEDYDKKQMEILSYPKVSPFILTKEDELPLDCFLNSSDDFFASKRKIGQN